MKKIVLVDDEEIIRTGISRMVPWGEHGLDLVYQAKHGLDALEYLRANPVDIVLTDIKMPIMDGIELVRRAKEEGIGARFIVLTGFGEFEYARSAMQYGVQHYLLKPCDEGDIIQACLESVEEIVSTEQREWEMSSLAAGAAQNFMLRYLVQGECSKKDFAYFSNMINPQGLPFRLVLFRCEKKDPLLDYALSNIADELFGELSLYYFSLPEQVVLFLCTGPHEVIQQRSQQAAAHMAQLYSASYTTLISQTTDLQSISSVYWAALENRALCKSYQDSCINEIIQIVEQNLHDPDLNLKWIARNKIFMNENYLSKLFIRVTGEKFTQYLTSQRINKAKQMIRDNPEIKLVTLCSQLGFANNPTYFSTLFKNQAGMTLTQFRNTLYTQRT